MCRVDYCDEFVEPLGDEDRKARKKHICSECGRTIRVGETYNIITNKFEGKVQAWKTCLHCQVLKSWLNRECNGYVLGGVEEDIREHWEEDGIRTRELAVLIWGIKRHWTKRNGDLMAIPKLQPRATGVI